MILNHTNLKGDGGMKSNHVPVRMIKINNMCVLLPIFIIAIILSGGCTDSQAVSENDNRAGETIDFSSGGIDYDVDGLEMSVRAKKILKMLIDLSNDDKPGVIVGQNCGHGSQICDPSNTLMGYQSLVEDLNTATGKYVGILGVDYEHDQIFTPEELSQCNKTLINYWNNGGLITINWSPHNPWLNDESDIAYNHGVWTDTRNKGDNLKNVDLTKLVDPDDPIRAVWLKKLDRIAEALRELRRAGVIVLWRPMQEMNGNWFWWGYTKNPNNPDAYKDIFIDMYNYFTDIKGLDNLIWVYSPSTHGARSFSWAYPGDSYVNVAATTAYGDGLTIRSYEEMSTFNRPIVMAEYGGAYIPAPSQSGAFDNRKYIQTIQDFYPKVAYFVCWHNWDNGGENYVYHSISKNQFGRELMNNSDIITREKLNWKSY
jgi:mannan endo-1,4-beta-mannosidase